MIKDDNKKTHIIVTGKGGGGSGSTDWNDITNKPNFATVATSGSYEDLTNKPTILTQWFGTQAEYDAIVEKDPNVIYNIEGSDNVQADWNQTDTTADDYIKNKPTIPAAQVNADWNSNSGVSQILNKPSLATVATSGDYDDLSNKPTIPAAQVNSDWNSNSGVSQILNKPSLATVATSGNYSDLNGTPTLATVATSGDYNDLQNKPTIPAAQVNSDWNANSGVAQILNKPTLATVATTGSYNDLSNKPTIPAAPVQSNWNESDSTSLAYIQNKPTVPTVPPMATETLTFTLQGGTVKIVDFYTKPMSANYFFVQDLSGNGGNLTFQAMDGEVFDFDLYTSTDQQNWTVAGRMEMFAYFQVPIPANGRLYIKATTDRWGYDEWFESDVRYAIGGNLMSLLFGDNFANVTTLTSSNTRCFNFHYNANLYDASNLVLPATTLAEECYYEMFSGCTSLTAAPALPATTLATGCYNGMFYGCTSLTQAPELPATTLATYCYNGMFNGCTNLNSVTTYAQDISATDCLNNWLNDVSATGEFYNLGNPAPTYPSGASGIPSGWTEHTSL